MAQTCSRCGAVAGEDAYFCPRCSNRLTGPSFAVPAAPEPPRRSHFPLALLGLGLCLIVGVVAALVYVQVGQIQRTIADAARVTVAPTMTYVATPPPSLNGLIVEQPGQPDAGVILFGSSFDPDTMVVSGATTKVALGSSFAIVAHFSQTVSQTGWLDVRSGKTTVTHSPLSITGDTDYWGFVASTDSISLGATGAFLIVMTDIGGNELARGTLTIGG